MSGIEKAVEEAFREGYNCGYDHGLSDGHPLGRASGDLESAWDSSESRSALSTARNVHKEAVTPSEREAIAEAIISHRPDGVDGINPEWLADQILGGKFAPAKPPAGTCPLCGPMWIGRCPHGREQIKAISEIVESFSIPPDAAGKAPAEDVAEWLRARACERCITPHGVHSDCQALRLAADIWERERPAGEARHRRREAMSDHCGWCPGTLRSPDGSLKSCPGIGEKP